MSTVVGLIIGIGGILLGNLMEGGHTASLIQGGAAFIVFGGTLGATLVANNFADVRTTFKVMPLIFKTQGPDRFEIAARAIVDMAKLARKESILAIEKRINRMPTQFMQSVFRFVIDGVDPLSLRQIFEPEMLSEERRLLAGAKVLSDAGGYAPTIGIIGAVLGLIHVMANLTDTSRLGQGIAVAFVATIYGIASANLFFLPLAAKMRRHVQGRMVEKRMILDGAISILNGMNPYAVEEKLKGYMEKPKEKDPEPT